LKRINWAIKDNKDIIETALNRYSRFLEQLGRRPSTISSYVFHVEKYLQFAGTDRPSDKNLQDYREHIFDQHWARSTLNNSAFAVTAYHSMMGEEVKIPILTRNETLPFYFTEGEIVSFFSAIDNLKHLCIFQVLFYAALRASELCNLDDVDLDVENLTLRIREGKGGREGYAFLTPECARSLKQYLSIRPSLDIDGRQPLFFTEYGNRWRRGSLYLIFGYYKVTAGIEKKGGPHVFGRHSAATLMTSKGVPLNIVQNLLRHKDIRSTLRYAHVDSMVARDWHDRTMRLNC
jgi:integrase/recombinase XerD